MLSEHEFMRYISAFNAGDSETFGAFYAPSIAFRNGAGAQLQGPAAVIAYYEALKGRIARQMEVRAVIPGEHALCAALHSRFEILSASEPFANEVLKKGDAVLLDSMALYELEGTRIARIEARSLSRRIIRAAEQA
ncbi:nuclear transport factor 2 family protein [Altererythrobacter sp. CC-YST694]|uniref:nuclear transport factor 2 family protein n=1 Tax=Altererythrobacter sp. CC-YST694 TaxID=2755038 RepID=UPI001D021DDC|nr:nuclear transport factor 2 family protein [Altererythrobacter sp. CC-YST694]MCB5426426.1 nuclear transport factor 2 family protein [Altererythrobacter sp. CC-YST694]